MDIGICAHYASFPRAASHLGEHEYMSATDVSMLSTLASFFAYRIYIERFVGPDGLVLRGQHLDGFLDQIDGSLQVVPIHF